MPRQLPELPDLDHELSALLRQIPAGRVTTFGTLADALGSKAAARWIGQRLRGHTPTADQPSHRVVRVDETLGGSLSDLSQRRQRLIDEGIPIDENDRVDLSRLRFDAFQSNQPLARLRAFQESLRDDLLVEPLAAAPESVAGLDVSYTRSGEAVGGYTLIDVSEGAAPESPPVWSKTLRRGVTFPYIQSFLTFRELPVLLELIEEVKSEQPLAEVLVVDGSGILHPRRTGLATALGVMLDWPTIGVTKKLLTGHVQQSDLAPGESCSVLVDDIESGIAVRPKSGTAKPLYLSPGHRTDVDFCRWLTERTLGKRRLITPVYWADRLSRQAVAGGK